MQITETKAGNSAQIWFTNSVRTWEIGADSSPDIFYIFDRKVYQQRFIIDSNGNVGIGTTPGGALHVGGSRNYSGWNTGDGVFLNRNSDGNAAVELRSPSGNRNPYIDFSRNNNIDYDVRLVLTDNDSLVIDGGQLNVALGGKLNQVAIGTAPFGKLPYPYESIQLPTWANLRINFGSKQTVVFSNSGKIYGQITQADWAKAAGWAEDAGWAEEAEHAESAGYAEQAGCAEEICHMAERNYVLSSNENFEDYDVVSLKNGEIVKANEKNDRGVRGVIEFRNGKPVVVVMGLFKIKVIGPVKENDLLVSSDIPGYAIVNNDAKIGTVIAKANEDFNGEKGVISCFIQNL